MSLVNIEIIDDVAFITLNNAKKLNCLSSQMCSDIIEAILKALDCENLKAMVIKAPENTKVWSAGHDIKELPVDNKDPLSYGVSMEKLLRAVQDIPIPVIAYIEGSVWGGACDFCLACDMIVAEENATFAITPAKIGIPYNTSGIMHFVNVLGLNKAKEMFFTATAITAQEAYNIGMLNHFTSQENLMDLLNEKILNPIRKNSILAITSIKRQFREISRSRANIDAESFEKIQSLRNFVFNGDDYKEGIQAFLEKRSPNFTGKLKDVDLRQNKGII